MLLCGDMNARSVSWGCNTGDARGAFLDLWLLELGLVILNCGNAPTCVRPQGSSVVDLSVSSLWMSQRITDWHVDESMETLSDHEYVIFSLNTGLEERGVRYTYPMWSMKNFNKELFNEAINFRFHCYDSAVVPDGVAKAKWLGSTITMACDCASKRSSGNHAAKSKYWWSQEIADARGMHEEEKSTNKS